METTQSSYYTILIVLLIVYAIIVTTLYLYQRWNIHEYYKEKEDMLTMKEKNLIDRESIVVDKEICFRELTKLKTIQSTALDVLKSYNVIVSKFDANNKTEHLENNITSQNEQISDNQTQAESII